MSLARSAPPALLPGGGARNRTPYGALQVQNRVCWRPIVLNTQFRVIYARCGLPNSHRCAAYSRQAGAKVQVLLGQIVPIWRPVRDPPSEPHDLQYLLDDRSRSGDHQFS
jgi:hypothetical protein